MARFRSLAMVVLLLAGCGQTAKRGAVPSFGAGGSQGEAGAATGAGGENDTNCSSEAPPDVPARLLHEHELENELARFGNVPSDSPDRNRVNRLLYSDYPEPPHGALVQWFHRVARELAARVTADPELLRQLTGCDVAVDDEAQCRAKLYGFVTQRLFRGLASAETPDELDAMFETGVELGGDFASGVQAVLELALQSPEFLYRIELGQPSERGEPWRELTGAELASRLSFLLWDRGPTDDVLSAAEQGKLADPAELEAFARNMIGDIRSRDPVRRFHRNLMNVLPTAPPDPGRFPEYTSELARDVQLELDLFVDEACFRGFRDFRALFAPVAYLNGPLATFYGLPGPSDDTFALTQLDPQRYAGLLTQPAFLVSSSYSRPSPTRRGRAISQGLLCTLIPDEPPDLTGIGPEPIPVPEPMTTRQALEQHRSQPVCVPCHVMMDPLGFGLDHFDAVGRWRDTENGHPIDDSGEVQVGDAAGAFVGPAELAARITESQDARDCYAKQWGRFAFGFDEVEINACTVQRLVERYRESGDDLHELLIALTQTDSFRYRRRQEGEP